MQSIFLNFISPFTGASVAVRSFDGRGGKGGHAKIAHLHINLMAYVKHLKTLQLLEYNLEKLIINFEDV